MRIQRTGFVDWQHGKVPPAEVRDTVTDEWLHDVIWADMDAGAVMVLSVDDTGHIVAGPSGKPQYFIEQRQVEVHWKCRN